MRRTTQSLALAALLLTPLTLAAADVDWRQVGELFGTEVKQPASQVHKVTIPRTDLDVVLDGTPIEPALALTSWLTFKPFEDQHMVMGDLVLTAPEVNKVLDALAQSPVQVTALHRHLLHETPSVMFLHVRAVGEPVELAQSLRDALARTGTPLAAGTDTAPEPGDFPFDVQALERILGHKGEVSQGVFKVSVPREETINVDGLAIPSAMGTAIALGFQPIEGGRAVAYGDFVMRPAEVNPVLKALKAHGFSVTALHNHMLTEQPELFFMHFWKEDEPKALAEGLRAALDEVGTAKPSATNE